MRAAVRRSWLGVLGAIGPLVTGCIPATAEVTVYGVDAAYGDAALRGGEVTITLVPPGDGGLGALADAATAKPDLPKPDSRPPAPACPTGSVGLLACDFSGIPDCANTPYRLWDYYGKQRAVVLTLLTTT